MHSYPIQPGLVGHEAEELEEGPSVERGALRPSSPDPRAYALELLKRNRSLRAFGLRHNPLAQAVIHPASKPPLLSRQPPQPTPRALGREPLQLATQPAMPVAHVLDRRARVRLAVAVHGDVRNTKVYSQHAHSLVRLRGLDLTDGIQIPLAADQHEVGLAALGGKQLPLSLATHERNVQPTIEGPERYCRLRQGERQDAIVVGDRTLLSEAALAARIELVCIGHFGDAANHKLCGQSEGFSDAAVDQAVKRKLAGGLGLPSDATDGVAGLIGPREGSLQGIGLGWVGQQLQLNRELHTV